MSRAAPYAAEPCPCCRYSLRGVVGCTCPECGVDAFQERRWRLFGPPTWPVLATLGAGSLAWIGLVAFAAWLVRGQTGFERAGADAFAFLAMLLALAGVALTMTLCACVRRRHLRRVVGEGRRRLQMIAAAPLGAAAMSWVAVLAVSAL